MPLLLARDKQNRKFALELELQIRPIPPRVPKEARKTKKQEEDDWYGETIAYIREQPGGGAELADLLVRHERERKEFRLRQQIDFIPLALRGTGDDDDEERLQPSYLPDSHLLTK